MNRKNITRQLGALFLSSVVMTLAHGAPLRAPDMDGTLVDIDSSLSRGRHVVLVFWQSWCGSCKREAPEIERACRTYRDRADFFGVISGGDEAVDERKVRSFISDYGLTYPQIRDRSLLFTRTFDVKGTPTIIILGNERRELYRGHQLPENLGALL